MNFGTLKKNKSKFLKKKERKKPERDHMTEGNNLSRFPLPTPLHVSALLLLLGNTGLWLCTCLRKPQLTEGRGKSLHINSELYL